MLSITIYAKIKGVDKADEVEIIRLLREGVYHSTDEKGLEGIIKSRQIKPSNGSLPFTSSQSANSYATHKQYVSLFDFETQSEEVCREQFWKCDKFFYTHKGPRILIKLDRKTLAPEIVTYNTAHEEVHYRKVKIPHVEVWYPKPIPLLWAECYFVIFPETPVKILKASI